MLRKNKLKLELTFFANFDFAENFTEARNFNLKYRLQPKMYSFWQRKLFTALI